MKKYTLPFLLLALSLAACRSLRSHDFHTNQSLPTRLPHLGLLVHERSFLEAFDYEFAHDVASLNATSGPYYPDPWIAYQVTDQALQDAFNLLGNEINENLSQTSSPRYGHARFKLLFYQCRNSGWGWTMTSFATLFVPNLVGMPVGMFKSEIELQMEIVDAEGKVLVRYTAPGMGKAPMAAYYGYDNATATRKANLLALKDAMSKIKIKLEPDVPSLASQLEAAGTLHKQDGK